MSSKFDINDFIDFDEKNKFHQELANDFEQNPDRIDPDNCLGGIPSEWPIYAHVKYPSGKYNFFHFNILWIRTFCEDISTIREQVKYLEACKAKFEYEIDFDDLSTFLCWREAPKPENNKGCFHDFGNFTLPITGIKFTGVHGEDWAAFQIEHFVVALNNLLDYKKKLLAIEEKYGVPEQILTDIIGQAVDSSDKNEPIHWLGSERQFAYLIEQLSALDFIKKENKWVNIVAHFVNKDGNHFKPKTLSSKASVIAGQNEKDQSIPLQKIGDIIKNMPIKNK